MKKYLLGFLTFGLFLAGCSENPPVVEKPVAGPEILSVTPENGVTDVTGKELTVIFKIIGEIFHKLCLKIKYFGGGGENIFSLQG